MIHDPFIEGLLLSYAAGNLGTHESLVVATWMALNGTARRRVAAFEALGGRALDEENPADLCGGCLETVLARIDAPASLNIDAPPAPRSARPAPGHSDIPAPLSSLLSRCGEADVGCWSEEAGVQRMVVRIGAPAPRGVFPAPAPRDMFLMKIAPGCAAPAHRHAEPEITLVLEGSYTDAFGSYRKGDICVISDPAAVHSPVAGGEGCLCLVLCCGEAPRARPLGALLRFMGF
jgi:putative transcriptional regulator